MNIVQRTQMEEAASTTDEQDVPPLQPDEANRIKPYIPRPPPTMQRLETFEEKAYRKVRMKMSGCFLWVRLLGRVLFRRSSVVFDRRS